jgi:cytochrome b561
MLLLGMIISEKLHKNISDAWAFTIGLVLYTILAQVPVVGWIVSFGAALFGLGASVQTLKDKYFSNNKTT